MKKLLFANGRIPFAAAGLPPLAFFLLCQLVFAQQNMSFTLFEKFNRSHNQTSLIGHRSKTDYRKPIIDNRLFNPPSVNSIWQPGKMIESSWDTVGNTWMFFDSTLYSYNINGDVTLEAMCFTSVAECQTVYTYNLNMKLIETLSQSWNGSSWDNSWRINYSYDANNNRIQEVYQNWNTPLSSWDNSNQYLYAYDANNNPIQYIGQMWNTSTSVWDNQWKEDDTYNVSNQLIQLLGYNWNGTSWDNSWKGDFTYSSGVLTYVIYYSWNGTSWDNDFQLINIIWYQWTGDLNTSLIQNYTEQDWNGTSYVDAYRVTCTYDAQGNNTDVLVEMWQTSAWVTDYEYKNIYAYDANNNIAQNIVQNWVQWMMAVRNSWRYDYSNYTLFSAVNENSSANNNILVYPNPTNGEFTVYGLLSPVQIQIYNVFGQVVLQQTVNRKQETVNLSSHPSGIYFITLKTGQGIANKKIMISH